MHGGLYGIVDGFITSGHSQGTSTVPDPTETPIEHADPVYNDFSTDLGARKDTAQINVIFGYTNLSGNHHELLSQLGLEFAPVNNLGVEILLP